MTQPLPMLRFSSVALVLVAGNGCGSRSAILPTAIAPAATLAAAAGDLQRPEAGRVGEAEPENIAEIPTEVRVALEALGAKITRQQDGYQIDVRRSSGFTSESVDLVVQCPAAVDLTMQQVPITDESLKKLRALPRLRRLILNQSPITSKGIATLAMLPLRKNLVALGLRETLVRDEDLAVFKDFPRLQRLDLSHTQITDKCLPALQSLSLTILNIEGTQISEAAVEKLKAASPQLAVKK